MAAGEGGDEEVRVLQTLRGKICQAKNLVPYSGPNKMRDCFCTINLDQEEVYRTQVVEKSLSPFFGEEFYFEIPRIFQCLSFYIYDKNVLQRDLRIGKVAIKKEDLSLYSGRETWFTLQPVDSNSEVQNNRWSCFSASLPFIPRDNKEHNVITIIIIIILELQSWKQPYGSLSPAPFKEVQWGIKLPVSGSAARNLKPLSYPEIVCITVALRPLPRDLQQK